MLAKLSLSLITVATALAGNAAFGQGCSVEGGYYAGHGTTHCGREISQHDAAGLWGNYCNETCFDFKRQRHHRLLGGMGSGCGSCLNGGFGYPASCGGCGDSNGCQGGAGGGAGFLHGGSIGYHRDRGHHRHSCLNNLFQRHQGNGCGYDQSGGLLSRLLSRHRNHHRCLGQGPLFRFFHGKSSRGLFATSAASCGTNGAYFSEAIGYEYGTGDIQSSVNGCGASTGFIAPVVDPELQPHESGFAPNSNDLDLPSDNAPGLLID